MVTSVFNICLYFNSILKETLKIPYFFPLMGFVVLFKNHIKILLNPENINSLP